MTAKIKTVFISASSSGIGYHLAKDFLSLGYSVIINGKNLSKLKKASNNLNKCDYFLGDLTNKKKIDTVVRNIKKKYKYVDILICNLGNSNFKKNNTDLNYALKNNLLSTTQLIDSSKKILKKNLSKIICISSICGMERIDGAPIGYSVAKSALNFYIKLISVKLTQSGIPINGIALGNIFFEGSVWQKKMLKNSIKTKLYIKKNVPINQFGSTKDVFQICKMLSENDSKFITGSIFKLDGAQTKHL